MTDPRETEQWAKDYVKSQEDNAEHLQDTVNPDDNRPSKEGFPPHLRKLFNKEGSE